MTRFSEPSVIRARLALVWLAFVVVCAVASDVSAQSRPASVTERARLHFASGEDLFRRGEYEGALREFTVSHEIRGEVALLYNIGSCHERLGSYLLAAQFFESYLAGRPDAENADELRERAQRLRARGEAAATSAAVPTAVTPSTDSASAATQSSDAAAPDDALPEPTPVSSDDAGGGGIRPLTWVAFGVGAAGLVAFGVFGGLALAEDSALADECGTSCAPSRVSTLETYSLVADIGLGVGVLGAALGVVLALAWPADSPRVDASVSADGARLTLHAAF